MFIPFDQETWILIVVSIVVPLISIQIINCFGVADQKFIYGGKVSSPTLNVTAILFGIRQTAHSRFLPKRSSSRMLFILFVIYSLIIRTCYQKLSFEFLTHDMYGKTSYTINDLIKNNYTFISLDERFLPRDIEGQKITNFRVVDTRTFIDIIAIYCSGKDSKFIILMNSILEAQIKHLTHRCAWVKTIVYAEDSLIIAASRNNEFSDLTIKTVNSLINAGMFNLHLKLFFHRAEHMKYFLDFPKVLTLYDLCLYFEIWLVSLLFPFVVFIFEVAIYKSRRIGNKFEEQDIFECIDLPMDAEEMQDHQNIQEPENEEEKSENHSYSEEENIDSVEENENADKITEDQLPTIEDDTAYSYFKEEKEIQELIDNDNTLKEEDKRIMADNTVGVSN